MTNVDRNTLSCGKKERWNNNRGYPIYMSYRARNVSGHVFMRLVVWIYSVKIYDYAFAKLNNTIYSKRIQSNIQQLNFRLTNLE